MTRTPDETKKGLECCARVGHCYECPYKEECLHSVDDANPMHMDALAYIQQLEAERDAYRDGLKFELGCYVCKHYVDDPDYDSNECMHCGKNRCNFEWRGVQKEEQK